MNVYQVIEHDYNSDDGHYEDCPEDSVYLDESMAVQRRNALNTASVGQWNEYVENEIARRTALWEANGRKKRLMTEHHWGMMALDPYCADGIADYKAKNLFVGDPNDSDAVERFSNRGNCLTHYTVRALRVHGEAL